MQDELANFLNDYVALLCEKVNEAKSKGSTGDHFQQGRQLGLYESLSLMQQQAIAFGIKLERIGMADFDPDRHAL